jgi:hypothetical protein
LFLSLLLFLLCAFPITCFHKFSNNNMCFRSHFHVTCVCFHVYTCVHVLTFTFTTTTDQDTCAEHHLEGDSARGQGQGKVQTRRQRHHLEVSACARDVQRRGDLCVFAGGILQCVGRCAEERRLVCVCAAEFFSVCICLGVWGDVET